MTGAPGPRPGPPGPPRGRADGLRVALVVPYYDPSAGDDPERVLACQPTLSGIARAEAARGIAVGAFQLFPRAATLTSGGVRYTFAPAPPPLRAAARIAHRAFPRYQAPYYEPASALLRDVDAWDPDVLHVFGVTLDLNLLLAARWARRRARPLVVHYHGGLPVSDPATRAVRRHNLAAADRVLFTSRVQADPWIAAGLLAPDRVAEVMETSTSIRPIPKVRARAMTGIDGDPACLFVGRLEAGKDPSTALVAFARIARYRPLARLHIVTPTAARAPLFAALAASMPDVAGRVTVRGPVPPEAMAAVYSSADILLHPSRREWSSLAVLEAMACGVVPVTSGLPPLRRMTRDGAYGRHFPAGDAAAMADAVLSLATPRRANLARAVRAHFQAELSFPALARDLEAVYASVVAPPGWRSRLGRAHGGR